MKTYTVSVQPKGIIGRVDGFIKMILAAFTILMGYEVEFRFKP